VDPFGVDKMGRLAVISTGRDDQVKFWDGLLGADWIGVFLILSHFQCVVDRNAQNQNWQLTTRNSQLSDR
jgi:hypothetical protein